jgi:diacylglycerol kinase family enzyme
VVVSSDAEARRVVEAARAARRPPPVLGLVGGDLYRTLGGGSGAVPGGRGDPERLRSAEAVTFQVDLGEVLVDGRLHLFVAHLVARTPAWRQVFVAMNAQWLGRWDLGPRSHPNDGLLDISDARLSLSDLPKVRARLPTGSHLPHPGITTRRVPAAQVTFARPRRVELDGVVVGRPGAVSVRVEPDALTVVV